MVCFYNLKYFTRLFLIGTILPCELNLFAKYANRIIYFKNQGIREKFKDVELQKEFLDSTQELQSMKGKVNNLDL